MHCRSSAPTYFDAVYGEHHSVFGDASLNEKMSRTNERAEPLDLALTRAPAAMFTWMETKHVLFIPT